MQRIEGDDQVELFAVRQAARVRDFKAEVWVNRSIIVTRCEFNHVVRRIDANDRGVWDPGGNFRRDLSVSAADVENVTRPVQVEQRQYLFGHCQLQSRYPLVICSIPFRQRMVSPPNPSQHVRYSNNGKGNFRRACACR